MVRGPGVLEELLHLLLGPGGVEAERHHAEVEVAAPRVVGDQPRVLGRHRRLEDEVERGDARRSRRSKDSLTVTWGS